MTSFASAVQHQPTVTTNGMPAHVSTTNACVDLFFKIGAARGQDIIPAFTAAYVEDSDLALRIVLWARDVRGGAGEREIFRQVLKHLDTVNPTVAAQLLKKTPELGRWDDLLVTKNTRTQAFDLIAQAIKEGNGLAAKWMPRKGETAVALRKHLKMTPKQYRKTLVSLTNVVEQKMCAKDWDSIEFSHVPSLAHARYRAAFTRNSTAYAEYTAKLAAGDTSVKVNAGAVFPHDVLRGLSSLTSSFSITPSELAVIQTQWSALENFIGDAKVLPMVDVSGSMCCTLGGARSSDTCLDVAVALGLYCADKNTGVFKDVFLTFSTSPTLQVLNGDIVQKVSQMKRSDWGMSTDIVAAFGAILTTAKASNVPRDQMPDTVLIFSDMQFDQCAVYNDSAMQSITRQFEAAGYTVPNVVFWNLHAHDNVPARFNEKGVALVSGYSPSILRAVLANDLSMFTPESIMRQTVCVERYDW